MRNVVIGMIVVLGTLTVQAATRTTVANGNLLAGTSWDCGCVPAASDNLVILHRMTLNTGFTVKSIDLLPGSKLTTTAGTLLVQSFLKIQTSAELSNDGVVILQKDYHLLGIHSGRGAVSFNGTGIVYGNGVFSNNKGALFNNGTFTIDASADLDFSFRTTQLKNTVVLNNYGIFKVGDIAAGGLTTFRNETGAIFRIVKTASLSGNWIFHLPGNTVEYVGTGAIVQKLVQPTVAYSTLVLQGSGIGTVKLMGGPFQVNDELQIVTCTFDVRNSGVDHNLYIAGDWNNVSGRFLPRLGTVSFISSGTIYKASGIESFYSMNITGDHSMISDLLVEGQMNISNTFHSNGHTIHMTGSWNNTGTFAAELGQVIFEGTTASSITGLTDFDDLVINKSGAGSTSITSGQTGVLETLHLDAGTLNTNGLLYIRSNAIRTGRIGEIGSATLIGDVTVERFMDTPSNNWHLIGSPIAGSTLNQWKSDFITTGFPGSDYPTFYFNNITFYDETVAGHKDLGVYNAGNINDAVPDGTGCRAYVAGGLNKLTAKGTPHMGPFAWTLSYTDNGIPFDDGWNLIANPYASTIDWDDNSNWTKTNVKDAIYAYVAESGTFTSYIAGVGTNGGSQYIPSSQAFWVQTDGPSPALSLAEAAKSDVDETFRNNMNTDAFKIRMTTSGALKDEMAIRFHEAATMDFDGNLDAYEFKSDNVEMPSLGLRGNDGVVASIFSLAPMLDGVAVPMEVHVGLAGPVLFELEGMVACPWITSCAIYDAYTETTYLLEEGVGTEILMEAGDHVDRYFLSMTPNDQTTDPNEGDIKQASNTSGISMYVQGNELIMAAQGELLPGIVDITIHNIMGQLVLDKRQTDLRNQQRFNIEGLNGILVVQVHAGEELISVKRVIH